MGTIDYELSDSMLVDHNHKSRLDLRPFQYFLTKLSNDIEQAANITDVIIDHYTSVVRRGQHGHM